MMIPTGVDDVDEAHAALDETAREEAVGGEGAVLAGAAAALGFDLGVFAIEAVHGEGLWGFAAEVDQFGGGGLHAEGQFVAGDAGGDFGVVDFLETFLIELIERVEVVALNLTSNSWWIRKI